MKSFLTNILAVSTALAGTTASPLPAQQDLAFAYQYVFPLWAFGDLVKKLPERMPTNFILHSRELNTPGAVGVVRPNADTLYSVMIIDLSESDLDISIPEMPDDRFWVFPILTPYGDDLVNIGNLGPNHTTGKYLLKYSSEDWGITTEDAPEGYSGVIKFPTAYGLVTMRIHAERNEEDITIANELQNGFRTRKVNRRETPIAPKLDLSMFRDPALQPGYCNQSIYEATMKLGARLAPYNPPYVIEDRVMVQERLANAGLHEGQWTQPPATNLVAAVASANESVFELVESDTVGHDMGNSWTIYDPEYFGMYNSHYDMRYWVAMYFYLALSDDQSVYPMFEQDISLENGEAALFTFSKPPQIQAGGFWSLTAYGENQDLIENPLGRYSLGSVDNLSFPDGTLVNDDDTKDSEFQILLQASDIAPPSNWTANWLPTSPGGGKMSATLRWYGAEDSMTKPGEYVYPQVTFIRAITE